MSVTLAPNHMLWNDIYPMPQVFVINAFDQLSWIFICINFGPDLSVLTHEGCQHIRGGSSHCSLSGEAQVACYNYLKGSWCCLIFRSNGMAIFHFMISHRFWFKNSEFLDVGKISQHAFHNVKGLNTLERLFFNSFVTLPTCFGVLGILPFQQHMWRW